MSSIKLLIQTTEYNRTEYIIKLIQRTLSREQMHMQIMLLYNTEKMATLFMKTLFCMQKYARF